MLREEVTNKPAPRSPGLRYFSGFRASMARAHRLTDKFPNALTYNIVKCLGYFAIPEQEAQIVRILLRDVIS